MVTEPQPDVRLEPIVLAALRDELGTVSDEVVAVVVAEVPSYRDAFAGPMGRTIRDAVALALDGFLELGARGGGSDAGTPLGSVVEGAYRLGRGEARAGRSMEALLAAYRTGARRAWRLLSDRAVAAGRRADPVAAFAELVFAYIDELSAASAAGHTDELATTGRLRQRYLQRLGSSLLRGDPADQVAASAERADWDPPRTLTAVALPSAHVRGVLGSLDQRTLRPEEDLPDLADGEDESDVAVLLVPDADGPARAALLRALRGHQAHVGPPRPWTDARASSLRVLRARRLRLSTGGDEPLDTEQHLTALVVGADPAALADLRRQVLAPFADLRPATADRLAETLREWLLHQGRRDDVAAALHVHPQTVRYRMGQVRELFGDRLLDPGTVAALTVALANDRSEPSGRSASERTPASG